MEAPTDRYFAGFFDGEGCAGYYPKKGSPNRTLRVTTVNTQRVVIDLMQERFGGYVYERPGRQANHRSTWAHILSGYLAYDMLTDLTDLLPFLIVKADHVKALLEMVGERPQPVRGPDKTHCVHGHELTDANVRITSGGRRACRECESDRLLRRREQRELDRMAA